MKNRDQHVLQARAKVIRSWFWHFQEKEDPDYPCRHLYRHRRDLLAGTVSLCPDKG